MFYFLSLLSGVFISIMIRIRGLSGVFFVQLRNPRLRHIGMPPHFPPTPPTTGDNTYLGLFALLAVASLIGLVVVRKKVHRK